MRYSFNINRLTDLLLAKMFHKPLHLIWLKTALSPLSTTYAAFMSYRSNKLAVATINSSVNRLTKALNDRFEVTDIYLVHQLDYVDGAYEYLSTDTHYEEFDYLSGEFNNQQDYDFFSNEYVPDVDFVVRVPVALSLKVNEIKAFILKYTMAGRRFTIELY
ncbi:MAG: hypothetical protein P0Y49_15350 [Candidatus Pedobacter colombiensis]|uniref:Uncharacterized protein n=1 Tax=Candidatus Pedobacter colombiensis TaxID=3121371 RepID=A0AAJ6B646_9SPHI|nr:hypothetical protein [Pedobacter sp.]WEK18166.1 MAG: hypothetical protein P0Y49_15350 [Pedobacter sp.]